MSQDDVVKLLQIIEIDYPNNQIGKDRDLRSLTVGRWVQKLHTYSIEQIRAAYELHLARSPRFAPGWQDLVSIVTTEMTSGETVEAAWGRLMQCVRRYGHTMKESAQNELTGRVWAIVERFGWEYFCQMEIGKESTYYAQFRNAYETEGKREAERLQIPEGIRAAIQRIGDGHANSLLLASSSENEKEQPADIQQQPDREAVYNAVERLQAVLEGLQLSDPERVPTDAKRAL